jgi:hypothetical protein
LSGNGKEGIRALAGELGVLGGEGVARPPDAARPAPPLAEQDTLLNMSERHFGGFFTNFYFLIFLLFVFQNVKNFICQWHCWDCHIYFVAVIFSA